MFVNNNNSSKRPRMKTRATERLGIDLPIFTAQHAANRLSVAATTAGARPRPQTPPGNAAPTASNACHAAHAFPTTEQSGRPGVSQSLALAMLAVQQIRLPRALSRLGSKPPSVITQAGLGLPH